MLTLDKLRVTAFLIAIFAAAAVFLYSSNAISAAPPDENCYSSESICDPNKEPLTHLDDKCALCLDNIKAKLDHEFQPTPNEQLLKLNPYAEVIYPHEGDVFYVDSLLGYVDVPLRGKAHDGTRMLTGNELVWIISDGVRYAYAYAQGESTYARVYYQGDDCVDLLAILHGTILHRIVAYDFVGITICRQYESG